MSRKAKIPLAVLPCIQENASKGKLRRGENNESEGCKREMKSKERTSFYEKYLY